MPPRDAGPGRARLSRERVLHAGVLLADSGGLEAPTMPRFGADLGVGAMSLYKPLPKKEALLDGMGVPVFAQIELPSGDTDWRTAIRPPAIPAPAAPVPHPWATALMQSRTQPGPAT